jgi:ribosomal-protein-alanine N-acetyltransferase
VLKGWAEKSNFVFVILDLTDSRTFGTISLRSVQKRETQFGYVLARSQWGNGYVSEALTCLVDWSLRQPGILRASAFCDVENIASARVMEKAGMILEGTLKRHLIHPNISPDPQDCFSYARAF